MASSSVATSSLGFLLLTGNSILAVVRCRSSLRGADDDGAAAGTATAFVVASYACLLLLFYCLRRFEAAAPGSAGSKARAKAGVWVTTTLLTTVFSWRVAALVPGAVAAAGVWFMAGATVLGGYYALFLDLPMATEN